MLSEQAAGNENYDQTPVTPAIIDPGQYDLSWILCPGEQIEELQNTMYLTPDDISAALSSKHFVD
jgi:hypothetical protein